MAGGTKFLDAITATATLDVDAVGALSINSSTGVINIADDAVAQDVNIATGAAARTVTIGNTIGASAVVINTGTAGCTIDSLLYPDVAVAAQTGAGIAPTQAQSGVIFRVDASGGAATVTLPTAVVGMTYTFVLTNASNDMTINCAALTDSMLGAVSIMDDNGTQNSSSAAANGTTHDRCLVDVSAGTVVAGSYVRFTALTTTLWYVDGCVITGDGAQAAVAFSSN